MTLVSFLNPSSYIKSHLLSTARYNCGQASIQHLHVFVTCLLISRNTHKSLMIMAYCIPAFCTAADKPTQNLQRFKLRVHASSTRVACMVRECMNN